MPLLGCIADDFTGATDLASMLVRNGMRTVQLIGPPEAGRPVPDADALVVALKSRTAPVDRAVAESLAALHWLRQGGARQILFKYCSTFDSTPRGNIGPVADALSEALGGVFALVCPAFPANGRTVYQGHLFVGDRLLNESGMENHPLTPMKDADLVRLMSAQTGAGVGLIPLSAVGSGAAAIVRAMDELKRRGRRYGVVDALADDHLRAIGAAAAGEVLLTGGSGIAMGLPENFRRQGLLPVREDSAELPVVEGKAAILVGSCSRASLAQVAAARDQLAFLQLDPLLVSDAPALVDQALAWARDRLSERPLMIVGSGRPEQVAELQAKLGREAAGVLVETALSQVAEGLVGMGVRRLVVAGGETSGAVVSRLGVQSLRIGPEIDPGVPWTLADGASGTMLLALKSGNFGAPDFFLRAF